MVWNSALYDTKHGFVSKYGEEVVRLLDPKKGEVILDAGCGTGDLTAVISASGAIVEGVDSSGEMIRQAKEKFPGIAFVKANLTEYERPGYYDAIFSNAALHWILDKEKAVEKLVGNLKQGGRLVLEMGGKDNVGEIINAITRTLKKHNLEKRVSNQPWYFPSIGEYASLLEAHGFRVVYAVHFDRETELKSGNGIIDWIRMFGKDFFDGLDEMTVDGMLREIQTSLFATRFYNNKWHADYKRLRIVAEKV
ncbi:MAG: methyltransferase domain-containing protein [Ginsengibacter sp.]